MDNRVDSRRDKNCCAQQSIGVQRYIDPDDISVPTGYKVEALLQGLNTPIGLNFTDQGDLLIAEAGSENIPPRILRLREGQLDVLAEGFNYPVTGVCSKNGDIYVSHKSIITVIREDGTRVDIIRGLPSFGDYSNNRVTYGYDDKIYFGQGTVTNSGIVGLDNQWVIDRPYLFDLPGQFILINGINYETSNILIPAEEKAVTGVFRPFGVPNTRSTEVIGSYIRASGSILRANPDGSDLELLAWGFRNPVQINFDGLNQPYVTNQGYNNRGSRPIANALDEFHLLEPGAWYGWPDYSGGYPVNQSRFTPEGGIQPALLLASIPSVPRRPIAAIQGNSNIMGFDFNRSPEFGVVGNAYVAEFGSIQYEITGERIRSGIGHRISRIDPIYGNVSTFAINKTGFPALSSLEGGLGRPTDVEFGLDGAMYISDFSSTSLQDPNLYLPYTGVIWKVSRV